MSHINKFNEFNSNKKFKNIQPVNEFFGSILKQIFKAAKNRISVNLSKKIGDAKEVDKAIEEYESKMNKIIDSELEAHKKLIEYEKGMKETGGDDNELKGVKDEFNKRLADTKKQKEASKNSFNIKVNNIKKRSDDDNVKDYINLARAELAERLIARELSELKNMGADELGDDSDYKSKIESLEQLSQKMTGFAEKVGDKLNKILSNDKKDDNTEVDYKEGDKVKYERSDKKVKEAEIMSQDDVDDKLIRIKTDTNKNGFTIAKSKLLGKVDSEEKEDTNETEEDNPFTEEDK